VEGRRLRSARASLLAACLLAVSGCSPVDLLNLAAPVKETRVARDLAYGDGERRRLDVYAPTAGVAKAPVVVFFYGGRWRDGERADYAFVGATLADHGVVAVVPDYRLYPEVRFPAFVRDGAAAVRWTRANIARFGGDPAKIYLMGHSAGAHIATLLALDRRFLGGPARDGDIAGVIGLAGPYDFLPLQSEELRAIFGPPERFPRSQPIRYARGDAPPVLLLHGLDDTTVLPSNTRNLAAAIRAEGGSARTRLYPHISHAELLGAFSGPLEFLAPVRADVLAFIGHEATAAH